MGFARMTLQEGCVSMACGFFCIHGILALGICNAFCSPKKKERELFGRYVVNNIVWVSEKEKVFCKERVWPEVSNFKPWNFYQVG